MAKGENIFKRKDGRWEARFIKGYELSGRIRYGFCYGKTYREAKEKVEKCKAALTMGLPLPKPIPHRQFVHYCDEWLRIKKNTLKESTYIRYETILRQYVRPRLGEYHPLGITTAVIQAFSDELLNKDHLASKTVKDILMILHSILKYTARVFPNAFPDIEIPYPKMTKKEVRVLSRSEQERFIAYLLEETDPCKLGILLAMFTGIRIGELCALQWKHVSLSEKTIQVAATMQRIKNLEPGTGAKTKILVGTPKSSRSVRTIPVIDEIAALCRKMYAGEPDAYLLTGTADYMEPRTLQYRLKKYTEECGLSDVHFHTFRHTFATRCVEVGFDVKSLSEILGHATTTITLDRYVHSSMELKRQNMDKLSVTEREDLRSQIFVS